MASSISLRRSVRLAATAAVTALVVVAAPSGANATPGKTTTHAPTTSADAKKQLDAMSQRMEIVTEQYNGAVIELGKRKHEAAVALAEVSRLRRNVHTMQGEVKNVAISAYQNGHLASFSSFVTSKSPQTFLDQLSTLNVIAQKQTSTLEGLTSAQKRAVEATARALTAEAAAKATTARLRTQKATINGQVAQLTKLMHQLSAKELAAFRAAHSAPTIETVSKQQTGDNPPQQSAPPPAGSGKAAIAVKAAEAEIGKPYVWGAAGPDSFDCSGLMVWAWGKAGVSLPHQSAQQYSVGTHISQDQLQPGDLVFYYSPIHHVAMYVGHGMVIQAPDFGVPVGYAPVDSMPYTGATRLG